jgi:hypothetical protein
MSDMVGHYMYIHSMLLELNIMVWDLLSIDPFPTVNLTEVFGSGPDGWPLVCIHFAECLLSSVHTDRVGSQYISSR